MRKKPASGPASPEPSSGEVRPTIPPIWLGFQYYESSVQLVLRDIVKRGDLVFDVGANIGGISLAASRAVGPFGQVVSFEISPRVIPELLANLRAWGANNVHLIPRGVWTKSNQPIELFFGEGHYADSVMRRSENVTPDHIALTVALDDFVKEIGRAPQFVKFDIEGAEYDALLGFQDTIRNHSPNMILEMRSDDERLVTWLTDRGYSIFNAEDYSSYKASADDVKLVNIVAIAARETRLLSDLARTRLSPVAAKAADEWRSDDEGCFVIFDSATPGRYVMRFEARPGFENDHVISELQIVLLNPYRLVNLHIAQWAHLAHSYDSLPFHVDAEAEVVFRIKRRTQAEVKRLVGSVSLHRLECDSPTAPWLNLNIPI
jgi:FkbM family methyltransferase